VRPVSTILDRFRRAAGVPAAPAEDLAAELAPVFAALDDLEAEADRLREGARTRAEKRLAAARDEAARTTAQYRERAEAERRRTAAELRRATEEEILLVLQSAEAEARQIRERGAARVPAFVAAALACVQEPPT